MSIVIQVIVSCFMGAVLLFALMQQPQPYKTKDTDPVVVYRPTFGESISWALVMIAVLVGFGFSVGLF